MTETSPPEPTSSSTDYVQSLARGLSVVKAFDAEHPRRTLSEVARATGLTRATARRFLLTLTELGYVRCDGSAFWLTPRVLDLGYSYLSSLSLPDIAGPHLEALSESVHESTSVSILDDGDVVYVARVPVRRIMTVSITIGTRFPAFATSMGRVLLAGLGDVELDAYLGAVELTPLTGRTLASPTALRNELANVRSDGFSIVDEELEEGLRSLAAPIRDRDGAVVAAVNISTQAARYTLDAVHDSLVPAVVAAAADISADLARIQPRTPRHDG
ncbi:IclR family transcriptional regulator [Rhodococcus rhodnii]|uniref:Glycerol operon regulatory protein n=2 Tax=Rhodococcus rhodnii TaxID=38312 RepID=R7WNQ7_9NOCA|nr:IclR family transcriptional regulator C-terminal domain-containing protein [Rhodococcus rhodnii]EOM76942.1 IclR family transcriptional regulator [Rhodococcus rhodnii LMG 5362]TXG89827.1 IclR family transcriptional regulator [Rhodococcus rhodnii]